MTWINRSQSAKRLSSKVLLIGLSAFTLTLFAVEAQAVKQKTVRRTVNTAKSNTVLASTKGRMRAQPRRSLLSNAPSVVETVDKRNRVTIKVRTGDTLIGMLGRINISPTERAYWARSVIRDMGDHILRPGQEVHFFLSGPGIIRGRRKNSPVQLKAIEIEYPGANLTWERGIHGILFQNGENPFDVEFRTAGAIVENSFVDDARKAGISPALLTQLANIFHTEIDFDRDLQKGDSFKILYEQKSRRGRPQQNSLRIMAAEFLSAGNKLTAVYFEKKQGAGSYYNLEGRSMARAFLRFPVDFTTITSQFAASRFNPILRSTMPHTGVDFAAERGTPVRAVGDGVITQAGWNGGYGKAIDLQHDATYMTRYAHLDSFAEGIQPGSSVKKGDVIGFVGSTGRSTGPHLHFELYKDNQYIDPLSVEFPAEDNIEPSMQKAFESQTNNLLAELSAAPEL